MNWTLQSFIRSLEKMEKLEYQLLLVNLQNQTSSVAGVEPTRGNQAIQQKLQFCVTTRH